MIKFLTTPNAITWSSNIGDLVISTSEGKACRVKLSAKIGDLHEIYSSIHHPYNSEIRVKHLAQVVKSFMQSEGAMVLDFKIEVIDSVTISYEFTAVFSETAEDISPENWITHSFMTSLQSISVTENSPLQIPVIYKSDETPAFSIDIAYKMGESVEVKAVNSFLGGGGYSSKFEIDYIDASLQGVKGLAALPDGAEIKTYTISMGKRHFTVFIGESLSPHHCTFKFRNRFNGWEFYQSEGVVTRKISQNKESAVIDSKTRYFNRSNVYDYSVKTPKISYAKALWLTELILSSHVTDDKGHDVIMTDTTGEISDIATDENSLTLSWRYANANRTSASKPFPEGIFTPEFKTQFT